MLSGIPLEGEGLNKLFARPETQQGWFYLLRQRPETAVAASCKSQWRGCDIIAYEYSLLLLHMNALKVNMGIRPHKLYIN